MPITNTVIQIAKGLGSWVPGLTRRGQHRAGAHLGRYCYSVWLRHLVGAAQAGLNPHPRCVAELGPGHCLGTGLAALLCGARAYTALDVESYAEGQQNLGMLDELVELFSRRAPIPDDSEFPALRPKLESYRFPELLLPRAHLSAALSQPRIQTIREALSGRAGPGREGVELKYVVPWHDPAVVAAGSVDMVFSQSVLQYVPDLSHCYRSLRDWLRPGGFMSHQIDLSSLGRAGTWDGHRRYSQGIWTLLSGRRTETPSRQPCSVHVGTVEALGFRIAKVTRVSKAPTVPRERLARPFRDMSEVDRATAGLYLLAVKPG